MGSFLKSRGQDFEIFNDLYNPVNLHISGPFNKDCCNAKKAHFLYHPFRPFSLRVFKLEGKTMPPIDWKFSADLENGVSFEIEGVRF